MTRFRCIGPACESSCCEGWSVQLDRAHYERTARAMRATPASRQEFDDKVARVNDSTRSEARHALMVLNDGVCGFLTTARLCSLQQRYGEEVLSDTCAQYPRLVSRSGARWELSGTASCPEVARQLLLHDDALALDPVPTELLSRRTVKQRLPASPAAPYVRHHEALRDLVLEVLSDLRFDLGTRLAMVAWFSDRTRPFLHRSAETLDEGRLCAEVASIRDPDQRALFADALAGLAPTPTSAVRLALAFLVRRSAPQRLDALRATVLRTYVPWLESDEVADAELTRAAEEIAQRYPERRARFEAFEARIDRALTNLAKNFWVRNWYHTAPDLLAHHMELLVQLTVVRLLVIGHPLLVEAELAREPERGALLDRAVVDAVHRFSRSFEHSATGLAWMRETLQTKRLVTLANTVGLARFGAPQRVAAQPAGSHAADAATDLPTRATMR